LTPEISDEFEIPALIARQAWATDYGTLEQYVANWIEDPIFESPSGEAVHGRAANHARVLELRREGLIGPDSPRRHIVCHPIIFSIDGDIAESETHYVVVCFGESGIAPSVTGRYHDTLRRTPEGWKIARRRVTHG
jgi:3-phenylpropionate/cinnamic acid dioxygenase small subunit